MDSRSYYPSDQAGWDSRRYHPSNYPGTSNHNYTPYSILLSPPQAGNNSPSYFEVHPPASPVLHIPGSFPSPDPVAELSTPRPSFSTPRPSFSTPRPSFFTPRSSFRASRQTFWRRTPNRLAHIPTTLRFRPLRAPDSTFATPHNSPRTGFSTYSSPSTVQLDSPWPHLDRFTRYHRTAYSQTYVRSSSPALPFGYIASLSSRIDMGDSFSEEEISEDESFEDDFSVDDFLEDDFSEDENSTPHLWLSTFHPRIRSAFSAEPTLLSRLQHDSPAELVQLAQLWDNEARDIGAMIPSPSPSPRTGTFAQLWDVEAQESQAILPTHAVRQGPRPPSPFSDHATVSRDSSPLYSCRICAALRAYPPVRSRSIPPSEALGDFVPLGSVSPRTVDVALLAEHSVGTLLSSIAEQDEADFELLSHSNGEEGPVPTYHEEDPVRGVEDPGVGRVRMRRAMTTRARTVGVRPLEVWLITGTREEWMSWTGGGTVSIHWMVENEQGEEMGD